MSGREKWSDVRDERLRDEAARERYDAARQALDADLDRHRRTLRELRKARELTQQQLAKSLRVSQAQVSRIESQTDLYLSTLRSYVAAMGGELELRIVFGDGSWTEVELGAVVGAPRRGSPPPSSASGLAFPPSLSGVVVRIVQPNDKGGWVVRKPGAARPSAVADTKAAAVRRAEEIVGNGGGGEVVVHGRDGRSQRTIRRAATPRSLKPGRPVRA